MPLNVDQGFERFLGNLIPRESQRDASSRHRKSVEASLNAKLDIYLFRETGSFGHGTGVRDHCDVDLMVSIKNAQPGSSDTALAWVKNALNVSFPYTTVRVSRPAVVVDFNGGDERWEIIPAFIAKKNSKDIPIYNIPGPASGWIESAPLEHISYVRDVNSKSHILGGAKKLARLAKAWKYYCNVPISSFYLEMRATKYIDGEKFYDHLQDICRFFEHLEKIALADMNDPRNVSVRFSPCSSVGSKIESLSKVKTAATRARNAVNYYKAGDFDKSFQYLDLIFGGRFPSRYS